MTIKARQIALINCSFFLLVLLVSCGEKPLEDRQTTTIERRADELVLKPLEGRWYYQNRPFNGVAISYYTNGAVVSRIGYVDGKKEGPAQWWFDSGQQQKEANFKANRLHGTVITWWPSGVKSTESSYEMGVLEGVQKRWHSNGQIARKTQLVQGKEEGMQQAWLSNGKLYVNYQAKNGRIFGLKKSILCYELENEIVQH